MKCPHCGKTFQPAKVRGSRLPTPFMLNANMRAWAAETVPTIDVKLETEKFCDYWRAIPGQRGVKLDWQATWRNWLRAAAGWSGSQNGASRSREHHLDPRYFKEETT